MSIIHITPNYTSFVHNTIGKRNYLDLWTVVDHQPKSTPLARPNCDVRIAPPIEYIYYCSFTLNYTCYRSSFMSIHSLTYH